MVWPYIIGIGVVAGATWLLSDKIEGTIETVGDEIEDTTRAFTDLMLVGGALYLAYILLRK